MEGIARGVKPFLRFGRRKSPLVFESPIWQDARVPAKSQPVVLIHGLKDNAHKMRHLARHLQGEGWEPHACTLAPSWGQLGIDQLAAQLDAFIRERVPAETPVDLVGFSMGGLVGRYYLQRMNGLERVRRFVTIATPHRGTVMAYFVNNPGCRQMRPGSPFLRDLERDADRLAAVGFTSLWTPLDAIILPSQSSVLPEARCRRLWSLGHPFMITEPHCLRAVAEALRG